MNYYALLHLTEESMLTDKDDEKQRNQEDGNVSVSSSAVAVIIFKVRRKKVAVRAYA